MGYRICTKKPGGNCGACIVKETWTAVEAGEYLGISPAQWRRYARERKIAPVTTYQGSQRWLIGAVPGASDVTRVACA